jgi:ATP-dependent Clp protease ATP-binding subunit ClpC
MTTVGVSVKGLVARAQREAQRRGQGPTTAHLLLVMLQSGGPEGGLLSKLGVKESPLLSAIRAIDSESTSALERGIERAYRLAQSMQVAEVQPAHLLLAVLRDGRSAAHRSLEHMGTGSRPVQEAVKALLGLDAQDSSTRPTRAERPKRPLPNTRSSRVSTPSRNTGTPPRVPLIRIEVEEESTERVRAPKPKQAAEPAQSAKPSTAEVSTESFDAGQEMAEVGPDAIAPDSPFSLDQRAYPTLTALGRNLTELAHLGGIDEVIGRQHEIEQLLDVLARRRSNNPILVGPPGVGKTAIVEGLALKLTAGAGVQGLEGKVLIELSAGGLVSGTGVRGALSERLRRLRAEVKRGRGRIILFIDEVHALFTGGESPDDLAHELKAALARGELPCVGATTDAEYRKYVERDAALARRFSPIHVSEPSADDAIEIIQGIAPSYEVHHDVEYEADAIRAAVELSVRYLPEQTLPDKAIGLIDLAGARMRRRDERQVTREAIAQVVAEKVRVPLDRLLVSDAEKLLQLEGRLSEQVVGHAEVKARVADALRKGAAGFHGDRPLATFLFLGPTGVGKTETARALNELFFPGCAMTRIDMSELSESHAISKLVGAPPGYVGHDAGGQLTESIRRRPYQLVLLDEIEKAHMDVLQALLPLLEDGRMTDGKGRTVDCRHTIIVMTSNLGAEASGKGGSIGFREPQDGSRREKNAAVSAARRALPPELWNRIDEPLFFAPLGPSEVREIARRMLGSVASQLRERQGIELRIDDSVIEALVLAGGYDVALGARPMRRVIGRIVEAPLASAMLSEQFARGDCILVSGEGDQVRFELASGSAEAAE